MKTKGTKEWACTNINFSKGCSNGCLYCYARRMANRFGWKKDKDWINMENKDFLAEKHYKKRHGTIMSPSSHDITSKNVDLAIKVFTNILKAKNDLLIVSKPNDKIIHQLLEEIQEYKEQVFLRFTIGTVNDEKRRYWEPYAPSINRRLNALKVSHDDGWNTSVSIEPFLDDQVVKLIEKIHPYITHTIWVGPMNKVHVPKEYWNNETTQLYSKENLLRLKSDIDALDSKKILYKDHFYHSINGKSKKKK